LIPDGLAEVNSSITTLLTLINSSIASETSAITAFSNKFTNVVGDEAAAAQDIAAHRRRITKSLGKSTISNLLKHANVDHGDSVLNNSPTKQSCATLLQYEMSSGEDMDGNGKTFGVDFAIIDDETRPAIIPMFQNSTLPEISFGDYKAWAEDDTGTVADPLA
jgi:hypothetical protein